MTFALSNRNNNTFRRNLEQIHHTRRNLWGQRADLVTHRDLDYSWRAGEEVGTMRRTQQAIASFDIFDTVVTRRVADPRAAFLLLGRRLADAELIQCSSHAFAQARTEAERRAFRNAGGLDSAVSLRDIHHELANALHFSAAVEDALYDAEIELERELLVPMPDGVERVNQARHRGDRIVYVSDMYLPSEVLVDVLRDRGLFIAGDEIFVSNELSRSKATGSLWPVVLAALGVEADQVQHVGNDAKSDGATARRHGIATTVLPSNNPNRYELALEEHALETDGLTSCLAGASRLARLDASDPKRQVIADVAAGVVAPFVIGNLLWTLEVAKRQGLAELFFVARDGQLLCDVARELAPKVGYTGSLTYIYGSRQAWSLASITDTNDRALESLVPSSGDVPVTLHTVLRRLELSPAEIGESLALAGFPRSTWTRLLNPREIDRVRSLVREDPDVGTLLRDRAKRSRDMVLSYLAQVGAVTDQPIGFVDLGTGATLFNALSSILSSVGQAPPTGFYFGLRSRLPDSEFGRPLTYVRDEDERLGFLSTPGLLTLVELACTADHGSVVGYSDADGAIEPIFSALGNEPVVDWGLPIVRQTVARVATEFSAAPDLVGIDSIDLRPAILDVFSLFWTKPTKAEAAVWGAYPFEDGWGSEATRQPIAESRGLRALVRRAPHRHFWQEGAQQLSGPITRTAFQSRQLLLDVGSKVRSRLR